MKDVRDKNAIGLNLRQFNSNRTRAKLIISVGVEAMHCWCVFSHRCQIHDCKRTLKTKNNNGKQN